MTPSLGKGVKGYDSLKKAPWYFTMKKEFCQANIWEILRLGAIRRRKKCPSRHFSDPKALNPLAISRDSSYNIKTLTGDTP
jgi:hypothetical protein